MKEIHDKLEQAQVIAGGAVTIGVGTSPTWIDGMTTIMELIVLSLAIIVGLTTVQLNRVRIKKNQAIIDDLKSNHE